MALLEVADNGVGFDTGTQTGGYGMLSMAERAELVGGTPNVRSRPGAGTTVTVTIPLEGERPSPPCTAGWRRQRRSVSEGVSPQRFRYSTAKLPRWLNPQRSATCVTVTPSAGIASVSSSRTRSSRRSRT